MPAPNAFSYNASHYAYPTIVVPLAGITLVAILLNISLGGYIMARRLYRHFLSSQFIVHLCTTDLVGLCGLVPLFLMNLWSGENFWINNNLACRIQVLTLFACCFGTKNLNKLLKTKFLCFEENTHTLDASISIDFPDVLSVDGHPLHDSLYRRSPSANVHKNPL
jgi:hypothetical protein